MTEKNGDVPRDILNIDEAAELLGVSLKTFNKVLHSEDMPARKIGREWKFSRRALIEWVGSGRSREFYREGGRDDDEDTLTPAPPRAGERATERAGERSPSDKPRGRRTAGWAIELD
jgi:excisionase family DNA binding protein